MSSKAVVLDDARELKLYDHGVVLRLARYLRGHERRIGLALAAILVYTITAAALPWIIKWIVDSHITAGDKPAINLAAIAFLAVATVQLSSRYLHMRLIAFVAQGILYGLRTDLFRHIHRLSLPFFDRNEAGRIMSRLQNDTREIEQFVAVVVFSLADLFSLVTVVIAMFAMSPFLAAVTMTVVPIFVGIIMVWQRMAKEPRMQIRVTDASVNSHLQETISGIRVVQSMNREQANMRRFKTVLDECLAAFLRSNRYVSFMQPAATAVGSFGIGFVVIFGGLLVLDGSVGAGVLIAFAIYVERFFDPLRSLTQGYNSLHGAMAAGSRVFELLDIEPDISDPPGAVKMPPVSGQVRFESVGFEYLPGVPVLQDVDLTVEPGQTVAIVGPTGAGKTTLVSLLLRLYETTSGRVLVDGHDIRSVQRDSLVHQTSIVMQEPVLFTGTIRENIRYSHDEVTDEDVERAARVVGAHEFVERLPEGYDTELQERGGNLSLGQRQLVSFARALAANPRILMLDEATAYVDTYTEMLIQRGLRELLKSRTSLVIAHRLSTVRSADKIVVMDQGRIVEQGTHDELVAAGGLYARLLSFSEGGR